MLKPLDALKKRQVNFIPSHFTKYEFKDLAEYTLYEIENWISKKLQDRFFIGMLPSSIGKNKPVLVVGFETKKELTYFMLACPYIKEKL